MQKEKGVFPPQRDHARGVTTLTGIIIIVAAAVILFGGVFAWQYFSKPVYTCWPYCPNMTDRDREQIKNDMLTAAGWKTYTNTQYGFQIRYPTDWEILKEETGSGYFLASFKNEADVKFAEKINSMEVGGPSIALYVDDNNEKLSLSKWAEKGVFNEQPIRKIAPIEINGLKGIKYEGTDYGMGGTEPVGTNFHVLFSKNNKIIDIITSNYSSNDKVLNIFNQMTSTFKFTPVK